MIQLIKKKQLEPILKKSILAGLTFNNSTNLYWGYFDNDKLIGFCGLMVKNNKAILKNDFVLKEFRNQGVYSKLNEVRFDYIKSININLIEGNMTDKSIGYHLKNGAIIVKEFKCCKTIQYHKKWQEQ